MIWKIEFDSDVEKDLRKLGATAQKRILTFLKKRIATTDDPRAHGKALTGDFSGLWRSITVNGNWRITFEFIDGDVYIVNYEDYH